MIVRVFSLNFSTLELKALTYETMSFKTQLKIALSWLFNERKKEFENIPG